MSRRLYLFFTAFPIVFQQTRGWTSKLPFIISYLSVITLLTVLLLSKSVNLAFPSSVWELASSQALSLTLSSPRTSNLAPALNCIPTSLLLATLTLILLLRLVSPCAASAPSSPLSASSGSRGRRPHLFTGVYLSSLVSPSASLSC